MNTDIKPELKIAIAPIDIKFKDIPGNLAQVKDILESLEPDVDLLVLPELFSTGYVADAGIMAPLAEPADGETINIIKEYSESYDTAICGSFICRDGSRIVNRAFLIQPDGNIGFYDKHHLFTMGGEQKVFNAGTSMPPVINMKGWKIMPAICYDVRFPAWLRNHKLKYDVLVVPANWAHSRAFAWEHLLIARAIENQAYVIGCNRSGKDEYGEYAITDSFAFNYWGKDIAMRLDNGIIYCVLNAEKMNADRNKFSPWRDADYFTFQDSPEVQEPSAGLV